MGTDDTTDKLAGIRFRKKSSTVNPQPQTQADGKNPLGSISGIELHEAVSERLEPATSRPWSAGCFTTAMSGIRNEPRKTRGTYSLADELGRVDLPVEVNGPPITTYSNGLRYASESGSSKFADFAPPSLQKIR